MNFYQKFERFFGGLKFAVFIISLFVVLLGIGTILESLYGTEFANKLVYKSLPFIFVQFLMFLSVLMALLNRLPLKKQLYGFYTIHTGLILIFIGSLTTFIVGVDGSMTLLPSKPNNEIEVNEDILVMNFPDRQKEVTFKLPTNAFDVNLGTSWENIKLKKYLPFSELETVWANGASESGTFLIKNDRFQESFTLSLSKESDFQSTQTLGLLNVHLLYKGILDCFIGEKSSKLIIWNAKTNECFTPEDKKIIIQKSKIKYEFFSFKDDLGKVLTFFPDLSPLPVSEKLQIIEDSDYRVFNKKIFEEKPNLFIFGKTISYFDKGTMSWVKSDLSKNNKADLPWMGFSISVIRFEENLIPKKIPVYTTPINENGKVTRGNLKAAEIEIDGNYFWATSDKISNITKNNEKISFYISKRKLYLPFQFTLTEFKMDKDPGTNNPASYESFVNKFDGKKGSSHHIYMNHPLKDHGFTFYQASYFPLENEEYATVLSANYDSGRPIKYLGSIFLVFGSIWHYLIRRKRKTTHAS